MSELTCAPFSSSDTPWFYINYATDFSKEDLAWLWMIFQYKAQCLGWDLFHAESVHDLPSGIAFNVLVLCHGKAGSTRYEEDSFFMISITIDLFFSLDFILTNHAQNS